MTPKVRQASQTKSTSEQLQDLVATHAASKAHRVRALENEIRQARANQVPVAKIVELLAKNNLEVKAHYLRKILYLANKQATARLKNNTPPGNGGSVKAQHQSTTQQSRIDHIKATATKPEEVKSSSCNPSPNSPIEPNQSDNLASTPQRSIADIRSEGIDMSELRRAGRKYRMAHEGKASK